MENYQLEDSLAQTDNALDVVKDEVRDIQNEVEKMKSSLKYHQKDMGILFGNVTQLYELLALLSQRKIKEINLNGNEITLKFKKGYELKKS